MMETLRSLTGPIVLARTRAPDLESVRKLNCWASEIEDISVVRHMPNLEVCSVSVNDITTMKDFQHCPNLQELYIRNNKIENLTDICYLKNLDKLRILWLADNPCATRDNYRMTVLRNLPQLQKLDNIVVQDEEIEKAKEQGEELCLPDACEEGEKENGATSDTEISSEATNNGAGDGDGNKTKDNTKDKDPRTLSWEETNKIREELGLKPLPIEKMTTPRATPPSSTRIRNTHTLQAILLLIKDLDHESLEILEGAVRKKLETL